MSDFVNTVDNIGDEALTNSIIDKSITEIKDNHITSIGNYAFHSCSALTTANFPEATSIGNNAFQNCSSLKTVNIPAATSIGNYAFQNCSSLKTVNFPVATSIGTEAFQNCSLLTTADFSLATKIDMRVFNNCRGLVSLIMRSATMATLGYLALNNTPIASGTGYIYVPASLIDSYKSASGWSSYANQFRAIEDYPEVCDPYSWDAVFKTIDNGTYKDVYKVGDTIPLDLGSEGVINMQIAAFDADTLADGTGTAAISWVGKELLATKHRWNPTRSGSTGAYTEGTGAIGGWDKSEIRSHLSANVKKLIPALILDKIVTVAKTHKAFDVAGSGFTQTTNDDVWIPSNNEVDAGLYSSLFPDNASRKKTQIGSTTNTQWWLRYTSTTSNAFYVNHNGYVVNDATSKVYGVCLGFCTGRTPTA